MLFLLGSEGFQVCVKRCEKKIKKRSFLQFLFIIIGLYSFIGCAGNIAKDNKQYQIKMYKGISKFISEKDIFKKCGLSPKQFGYVVYDIEKGKVVTQYNGNKFFIPGSVSKVPTSIAALNVLGGDFRFTTILAYKGKINNGVLKGDLYLKGFGDPLLKLSDLMNFIEVLKISGIRKVEGKLYYDQSYLASCKQIDKVGGASSYYNPGISALSLDYNRQLAHWFSLKKTINLFLTPDLAINKIDYSTRKKLEKGFNYEEKVDKGSWVLSSKSLPPKGVRYLPVKRPALFTALMFQKMAQNNKISIPLVEEGVMPSNCKELSHHKGLPLALIVKHLLQESKNMVAELILLATAKKISGKRMNLKDASLVISKWISAKITNLNWSGFKLRNGSGLCSQNRFSPLQIIEILKLGAKRMYHGNAFISLLPISGWKGTLLARLNDPNSAFYVWAKTGTMYYVSGIAGFFFTKSGKKMLFSLFISDFEKRQIIDSRNNPQRLRILNGVDKWIGSSREAQNKVISKWIMEL